MLIHGILPLKACIYRLSYSTHTNKEQKYVRFWILIFLSSHDQCAYTQIISIFINFLSQNLFLLYEAIRICHLFNLYFINTTLLNKFKNNVIKLISLYFCTFEIPPYLFKALLILFTFYICAVFTLLSMGVRILWFVFGVNVVLFIHCVDSYLIDLELERCCDAKWETDFWIFCVGVGIFLKYSKFI